MKFASLIKNLWSGQEEKTYPVDLIKILGQYAPHVIISSLIDLACEWNVIRCARVPCLPP